MSQLPAIYPDQSSIQISRIRYLEELNTLHKILSLETEQDIEEASQAIGTQQPFFLAYQGLNDRDLQQLYGDLVSRIMKTRFPQWAYRPNMPPVSSEGLLRVGIVSAFFWDHSNWKIPIKGWVKNLNKKHFELYGYYTGKCKDKETEDARHCFTHFYEDIDSFENLCQIIYENNLHVLIYPEIGMDPITVRLASLRLSPVQCTSWGHPNTSGLPTIDYFLSSDLMEPPYAEHHYTEQLVRLPNLSICYTPTDVIPDETNREKLGLRPNSILYLCCQALYKYLPQYDDIYPRIAQQIEDCQFLFISCHLSNWVTEKFRLRLEKVFKMYNLNADDYIVFLPRLDQEQYYAVNRLSDIYLDSIGWSGCNTTLEAIAHNLPILTLPGKLMRGRHSSAILKMMGISDTVASELDEYVEKAVRLGLDKEWRKQISEKVAAKKHLVYRDKTCITALEDFLVAVVQEKLN